MGNNQENLKEKTVKDHNTKQNNPFILIDDCELWNCGKTKDTKTQDTKNQDIDREERWEECLVELFAFRSVDARRPGAGQTMYSTR